MTVIFISEFMQINGLAENALVRFRRPFVRLYVFGAERTVERKREIGNPLARA